VLNLKDIIIRGVSMTNKGAFLLEDAQIAFNWGRRYGLVGKNGCGKSTLLREIAERQFEGIPKSLMINLCVAEVDPTDDSAIDTVLKADIERTALLDI
jgi:ATPase subunit of ABC transporter with duplicated ATPase domains